MGAIDTEAKAYLSSPDKVADAFNYWMYGGKEVIQPKELRPLDTTAIALPYGNDTKKSIQKIRDVLKLYTAMTDNKVCYLVLGIEIQAAIHYAMPVRNMLYDAIGYVQQVSDLVAKNKADGIKLTGGEYLTGLRKEDRLMPIITLVISLNTDDWDGPLSIHEMLAVENREILTYVQDYKLNLLSPAKIADADFDKFRTELGTVMQFIKHRNDKDVSWMEGNKRFEQMGWDTASLIKTVTGANIQLKKGESVNMWVAWENSMNQARNDGYNNGKDSAMVSNIRNLMETSGWDARQTMNALKIPASEQEKYAKQI